MRAATPVLVASSAAAAAAAAGEICFVGNYGGTIDTLSFDSSTGAIESLSSTDASKPGPSWQELSADRKFLYTVEESNQDDDSRGAITSYSIADDGKLTKVETALGASGPVSLAISPDQNLIFTANYGSASCSAYTNNPQTGAVSWVRDWTFDLPSPGPIPDRQDASHPHQALFDPTGQFIVVPDLGADLLRIFSVADAESSSDDPATITELDSVPTEPGTGPRHGLFYPATGTPRFYYVVGELGNTITAFSVAYVDGEGLKLEQIQSLSTLPEDYPHDRSVPAAGEILLLPAGEGDGEGKHIFVSNRLDSVFEGANSIASYTVDAESGKLALQDIFSAGVNNTRHFSVHPSGEWLVTEGVFSNDIVVLPLDSEKGEVVGDAQKGIEMEQPVCLTWL